MCVNVDASGERGAVRMGLVDALSETDALHFWYTLFCDLGFSVRVPHHDPMGLNALHARGRDTIPSESVCYPAKMSHVHAADVVSAEANAVFMPLYDRYARCAVSCEYANAVGLNMPQLLGTPGAVWDGTVPDEVRALMGSDACTHGAFVLPRDLPAGYAVFASPLLLLRKPDRIVDFPTEIAQLLACLNALLPSDAHIGAEEMTRVLAHAAEVQEAARKAIDAENARALAWAHELGHHGIVLVGRPYHWDRSLLHDVNYMLADLGFSVLTGHPDLGRNRKQADMPGAAARWGEPRDAEVAESHLIDLAMAVRSAQEQGDNVERPLLNIGSDFPVGARARAVPYWRASKHVGKLCQKAAEDPCLDVVCLQSFGCAYDAASVPEAREITQAAGKPFTLLMIDDAVNSGHVRIRLRTLAAAIKQRRQAEAAGQDRAGDSSQPAGSTWASAPCQLRTPALVPNTLHAAREGSIEAFSGLDANDYEAARSYAENYCYFVALIVGRALRICVADPGICALVVPYACYGCLEDALARTLTRSLGREISIVWERSWPASSVERTRACAHRNDAASHGPLVGIVGVPALVFEETINDNLVRLIAEQGCTPALPDLDLMLVDDVAYIEQLERFEAQGVKHIIYLMSFGCLKGHTQVRARVAALRTRFPSMTITIVDFDGDASSLNRTNRVFLALAAAKGK